MNKGPVMSLVEKNMGPGYKTSKYGGRFLITVPQMETGRVASRVEILRPAGQAGWKTGRILFSGY